MKERFKEARKAKKYTQAKLAEAMHISKSSIEAYEYGRAEITDRVIADVCRILEVNETWLRTGEGDMFAPLTREQEIGQITSSIIKDNNPIRFKLQKIVANLTEEQLEMIYEKAKELVEENLPE